MKENMKINNFAYYNPTKIYFGNEQLVHLSDEVLTHGKKVCLVYGGGSIKKNGLYDKIIDRKSTRLNSSHRMI